MIKSRPLYQPLQLDPAGRAHLLVTDLALIPPDAVADDFAGVETWVLAQADARWRLAERIAGETVGFRLYAVGSEAFLWDVHGIGGAAGLGLGEMFFCHAGSAARRVYCSHCKAMNERVATSIVTCAGCGANLFVRDHFSRRLAAFMGVAVDAEVPGEVPAAEVLYP